MIFSTFNQLNCFLLFLFFGIIISFIFNLFSVLFLRKYLKIYKKIIFESIFYTIFAVFFVFLLNFYNLGKFSFVLLMAYILGFIWLKFVSSKLIAILENKWYNLLIKIKPKRRHHAKKHKAN